MNETPEDDDKVKLLLLFSREAAAGVEQPVNDPVPTEDECVQFASWMVLSLETVDRVELLTGGQSACELWHSLHNGRMVSSRFW